jgi:hypothetical protein
MWHYQRDSIAQKLCRCLKTKLQLRCVYGSCITPRYADPSLSQMHKFNANSHMFSKRTPAAMLLNTEPREKKRLCEAADAASGRTGNAVPAKVACPSCPLFAVTDGLEVMVGVPSSYPVEEEEACGDAAGDEIEEADGDVN